MVMKKFIRNREVRGVKVKFLVKLKFGCNFIFGYLFFVEVDIDFLKKINLEIKEELEVFIDNLKMCIFLWRLIFFGIDCNFKVFWLGFECGFGLLERKLIFFFLEFELLVICKEGLDDCNFLNG